MLAADPCRRVIKSSSNISAPPLVPAAVQIGLIFGEAPRIRRVLLSGRMFSRRPQWSRLTADRCFQWRSADYTSRGQRAVRVGYRRQPGEDFPSRRSCFRLRSTAGHDHVPNFLWALFWYPVSIQALLWFYSLRSSRGLRLTHTTHVQLQTRSGKKNFARKAGNGKLADQKRHAKYLSGLNCRSFGASPVTISQSTTPCKQQLICC